MLLTYLLRYPPLVQASLIELLILAAAVALVVPDAARVQAADPAAVPGRRPAGRPDDGRGGATARYG